MATVTQAAALLDAKYGADWPERIDLNTLNQGSASVCVAGQLEPDNRSEVGTNCAYKARSAELEAVLGEEVSDCFGPFGGGDRLTDEWKALIRERRGLIATPVIVNSSADEGCPELVSFGDDTNFVLDGDLLTITDAVGDHVTIDLAAIREL